MAVLHMVHAFEHAGGAVVDTLADLATTHKDTGFLKDILRELSRVGGEESKDSAGVRHVADFLVGGTARSLWLLLCVWGGGGKT
jgi:hypothetical protein